MAPTGSYKETEKKPLFRWRWLIGIDQISKYIDYTLSDIMEWIFFWVDCPIKKLEPQGVWVVRKRHIKKFLREKNPPKTEVSEYRNYIRPKKIKRRKW